MITLTNFQKTVHIIVVFLCICILLSPCLSFAQEGATYSSYVSISGDYGHIAQATPGTGVAEPSGGTGVAEPSGGTGVAEPSGGTGRAMNPGTISIFDPLDGLTIRGIFLAILEIILVFAVPIVVFFIIWAGFLYVTAQGNQAQVEKATKALTNAVIGGLIVLGSYAILTIIENTIAAFI